MSVGDKDHDQGLTERANAFANARARELSRAIPEEQSEAEREAMAAYALAQAFVIGYAASVEAALVPPHRRGRR